MTQELEYLVLDQIKKLRVFLQRIAKVKKHIRAETYTELTAGANAYIQQYEKLTSSSGLSDGSIKEFLRVHQQRVAALIAATDWQSPSFDQGVFSRAGRQTGAIYQSINDYKRDQHDDAHAYERQFVSEYVDAPVKFTVYAYATSSGMAALSTVISFLQSEKKVTGPVVMGKSVWFQNKILIEGAWKDSVISVDQGDTDTITDTIIKKQPSVLFFDSLENSPDVLVPDLDAILKTLVKHAARETYLIIDNTCLTFFFQPLSYVFAKRTNVRLIVFESLNKYHQFGFDRTTGGIIWCYGRDTIKLHDYRVHTGTIMPDISALTLPGPNRAVLTTRLLRISGNISYMTRTLQQWIDNNPKSPFARIVFPGLPNHPSYPVAGSMPFCGSFFVIEFKPPYQSIPVYTKFVSRLMALAKKNQVDLVNGTSFGFDHTRVYLTAIKSTSYTPFIRISVGAESRQAIEALTAIFLSTLAKTK